MSRSSDRRTLFISRLDSYTTAANLGRAFEKIGPLVRCDVIAPKLIAFVEYHDARDAAEAYEKLHDTVVDGSRLKIEYAKSQQPGPKWNPSDPLFPRRDRSPPRRRDDSPPPRRGGERDDRRGERESSPPRRTRGEEPDEGKEAYPTPSAVSEGPEARGEERRRTRSPPPREEIKREDRRRSRTPVREEKREERRSRSPVRQEKREESVKSERRDEPVKSERRDEQRSERRDEGRGSRDEERGGRRGEEDRGGRRDDGRWAPAGRRERDYDTRDDRRNDGPRRYR